MKTMRKGINNFPHLSTLKPPPRYLVKESGANPVQAGGGGSGDLAHPPQPDFDVIQCLQILYTNHPPPIL